MFEFVGLIGVIFLLGLMCLAVGIVLLPFYLLFKLLGLAVRVGLAGIFLGIVGILLVPVAIAVSALLFIKLLILAIPLLLIFAVFSWLVGFTRGGDEPQTVYVQPVPPAQT